MRRDTGTRAAGQETGVEVMDAETKQAPPQDIPFWPDYMRREIGDVKWVLALRLTDRLRYAGHELAISPKRYAAMQAAHAAEVRQAVTLRLIDCVTEGIEESATPSDIVARLLEDTGLRIITDHCQRESRQ